MARTTGPLLSLDAAGTLAGALTYRRTRTSTAAYHKPTPRNPKTDGQQWVRRWHGWLTKQWRLMPAGDKALWIPTSGNQSAYHTWLQDAWSRIKSNVWPRWTPGNVHGDSNTLISFISQVITPHTLTIKWSMIGNPGVHQVRLIASIYYPSGIVQVTPKNVQWLWTPPASGSGYEAMYPIATGTWHISHKIVNDNPTTPAAMGTPLIVMP